MNLSQALKYKNRVVSAINDIKIQIIRFNVVTELDNRPVNIQQLLLNLKTYTEHLIDLKTKIDEKNAGIREIIERLREYKSLIDWFRGVPTDVNTLVYGQDRLIKRSAIFTNLDQQKCVQDFQLSINEMQDKIDEYNAQTKIDINTIPEISGS